MINPLTYCDFEGPSYLLFGANVPPLIYYSHLPNIILALGFAFFILFQNRKALPNQALFVSVLLFAAWVFLDSIFWASNRSDVIMLVWSLIILIEPLVYLGCFYLLYVLLEGKDMPFSWKALLGVIYIPIIIFTPTSANLSGFDIPSCLATEGPLALYYTYSLELITVLFILVFSLHRYLHTKDPQKKSRILTITIGLILFLLAFAWGNITGSFTDDWQLGQYGLFGMPIFIGFLVYSIVRFQIFNIKLIGSVALVLGLVALNFSLLFVQSVQVFRGVALATLIISAFFGALLIKSVKREIEQRKKIEKLAIDLEKANIQLKELDRQKDELLSIVSHQLATPVSSVKWYLEMLLDGDIGELKKEQKDHVNTAYGVTTELTDLVSMILDVSRIQLGKMKIEPQELDLNVFFKEILDIIVPKAKEKNVNFEHKVAENLPKALLDKRYTKMTIENLLSNAVKYTPTKGNVNFLVEIRNNSLYCEVKDTGCGIPKSDQDKIFGKLFRASNVRNTVDGNGFGLYIAKGAIEAQGGEIWFKSEEGKGTTFFIELPLKHS